MRLSEKTIELNFCSQLSIRSASRIIWFGLTQKQEARAGFDACVRYGGKLLIFQFKASNYILKKTNARRFYAPHDQLRNLQARVRYVQRSVFYVLPLVGTTYELSKNSDLLAQTKLLDVDNIPMLSPPTTKQNTLRKNGIHYIDVKTNTAVIHSDPVEVPLIDPVHFSSTNFPGADGILRLFDREFEAFWEFRRLLAKVSTGAIVLS